MQVLTRCIHEQNVCSYRTLLPMEIVCCCSRNISSAYPDKEVRIIQCTKLVTTFRDTGCICVSSRKRWTSAVKLFCKFVLTNINHNTTCLCCCIDVTKAYKHRVVFKMKHSIQGRFVKKCESHVQSPAVFKKYTLIVQVNKFKALRNFVSYTF
jgi:hypothetical protein